MGRWHTCPNDGNADPERATDAIARGVVALGGRIQTDCAVTGIETEGGCVSGIITESGPIKARTVVCAAGAWSSTIAQWLGVDLPQLRVRGTVTRTAPVERMLEPACWTPSMGFVQRQDGCFTLACLDITDHDLRPSDVRYARYFLRDYVKNRDRVSLRLGNPFWRDLAGHIPGTNTMKDPLHRGRISEPGANRNHVELVLREMRALFPQIKDVMLKKAWAGHIEITPDMLPVIDGETDGPSGFVVVTGLSGHGFGIGPGVGATVAELVAGEPVSIDLGAFRLGRFAADDWNPPYNLI